MNTVQYSIVQYSTVPDREQSELAHVIFQLGRSVLISLQGAVITLPYCFCNTEVRAVLRLHWNR